MLLDLKDICSGNFDEYSFEGSLDTINSSYKFEDLNLIFPISYKGKITNLIRAYKLNLEISYKYKTNCDRCLKEIIKELTAPFEALSYKDPSLYDEEASEDYFKIENQAINLDEIIISVIIMARPFKVLCKEDCRGLCPKCGTDLNEGFCHCFKEIEEENIDPRFAKLGDLFKNKEV